jgi:integrase
MGECQGEPGLLFKMMLNVGLRPEEMMGIKWADLHLNGKGSVTVRQVVLRLHGGGWRFAEPKTVNSLRRVGFASWLVAELKEHRKTQLAQRLKVGEHYKDYGLVFASGIGTPLSRGFLLPKFKKTLERAEIDTAVRWYDLRHSFVTLSLAAGVDAKTVSAEAGHADVGFTLTKYGHVLEVMREGAVDKREALLSGHK